MEEWEVLLIMDKFEQELDGMDRFAWSLKEKISREAWNKVRDLFYYDADCEAWLTLNPQEVIRRLADSEWELDCKVFKRIANQFSLENREVLYHCLKKVKQYGGAKTVEILRKAVDSIAGSGVKFSEETKVIEDKFNDRNKTEKIVYEKQGQKYVAFLKWMAALDDVGFSGLIFFNPPF